MKVHPVFSKVDADLSQKGWTSTRAGYAMSQKKKKGVRVCTYAHREVGSRMMGRALSSKEWCDHVNGNPLDNRRENLRIVTPHENSQHRPHASAFRGVSFCYARKKYAAHVMHNRKSISVGRFNSPWGAAIAARMMRESLGFLDEVIA